MFRYKNSTKIVAYMKKHSHNDSLYRLPLSWYVGTVNFRNEESRNLLTKIAACSPTETRTQSNRTKIWCATITPWGWRI